MIYVCFVTHILSLNPCTFFILIGCCTYYDNLSKNKRNLESEDVCNFLNADKRNIQVHLFVRKNKEDEGSKEFYYLGHMKTDPSKAEEINVANRKAVEIYWELDQPVREDLYQYITNG